MCNAKLVFKIFTIELPSLNFVGNTLDKVLTPLYRLILEIRLSVMALSNPSWASPSVCIGMTKIIGLFESFLAIKKSLSSSFWSFRMKGKATAVRRITKFLQKCQVCFLFSLLSFLFHCRLSINQMHEIHLALPFECQGH